MCGLHLFLKRPYGLSSGVLCSSWLSNAVLFFDCITSHFYLLLHFVSELSAFLNGPLSLASLSQGLFWKKLY